MFNSKDFKKNRFTLYMRIREDDRIEKRKGKTR